MRAKFKINRVGAFDRFFLEEIETGFEYEIGLTFYDVDPPNIGEFITFSKMLLDRKANEGLNYFCFGGLSGIYGREIAEEGYDNSEEILVIERKDEKIYLKRFYG